ncbi:MAG TPA: exosortase [Pyrinomonadaceae bacterium]|nr:exosortase [Pyrinomonadaceae bacterium]
MSALVTKNLWRVLAIISVLLFAYATVLVPLVRVWWTDENYSHGLLIPFIVAYILWMSRDRFAGKLSRPSSYLGLAAILIALFALWAGVAGAELYTQRLSLVLILVGLVMYFWGVRLLRLLLVPFGLLLLSIPIPVIVFNKIAFPLQLFASSCAVWAMRLLGIPVLRQGNVIELMPLNAVDTQKLEVVEACSGIRSLMTLMTLAVVFAYFTHPSPPSSAHSTNVFNGLKSYGFWRSTILLLSAVPIAILTNAFRVSGTGVLSHYYGTKVANGFFHSFSGWVIYIAAFLLLFGVGWMLDRFKPATNKPPSEPPQKGKEFMLGESAVTPTVQVITAEGTE